MSDISLGHWWQQGVTKFDSLVWRERLLVAFTLLAFVWMCWAYLLNDPIVAERNKVSGSIRSMQATLKAAVQEQKLLSTSGIRDPNGALRDEQKVLQGELEALELELRHAIDRFVAPQRMPELLSELMDQYEGLRFTRITRLPTEPLAASLGNVSMAEYNTAITTDAPSELASVPSVYRHPIKLEFEGSYFDVFAYLSALEGSSWRLNWRSLEYHVRDYPTARVTVQVDTLSRRKEWLGV